MGKVHHRSARELAKLYDDWESGVPMSCVICGDPAVVLWQFKDGPHPSCSSHPKEEAQAWLRDQLK